MPFIVKSQGRIALKLSTHQKHCDLFIPLIVSELEPKGGVDPSIVERQKTIGQRITQYEKDLENYNAERERIGQATTKKEDEIEICDYTERDRLEAELEEKYKDAIKWRGPLFGGPDLLPFVLKTCLELITLWVVKNTLQDLNDALWGKFKQAVKQVFNTKKINPSKKNDIALVIKQAGKKTVVFLFSINLTLDEAEDALTEAKRILASLTDDTLSKETYSPIVFRLNNSEKKWEESSDWMENDIRDGEKVGHVVNIDDKIVGLSPDDYIKKIKSEQSKTPNNGKKDEKESSN